MSKNMTKNAESEQTCQTNVELTCNALSHVDEILLDNKAVETKTTTIQFACLTMGAFFSNASKQHIIRHSAMQMVVMMVVMTMHVAMRREGAPTQTTTCSMIICEQTRLTRHVSESWGTIESQPVARRSDTGGTVGESQATSHTPGTLTCRLFLLVNSAAKQSMGTSIVFKPG